MMRIVPVLIAFLFNASALSGQSCSKQVLDLQMKYDRAIETKDSAFLSQLFHDEMIITGGDGTRRDKQQEIKDCIDPQYTVVYFKTNNPEVNCFENTAVLHGDIEWQLKNGNTPVTFQRRITFIYALLKGKWYIIAQHIGMMPK